MEQAKIWYVKRKRLMQQYNKTIQKIINFNDVTKETIKKKSKLAINS